MSDKVIDRPMASVRVAVKGDQKFVWLQFDKGVTREMYTSNGQEVILVGLPFDKGNEFCKVLASAIIEATMGEREVLS